MANPLDPTSFLGNFVTSAIPTGLGMLATQGLKDKIPQAPNLDQFVPTGVNMNTYGVGGMNPFSTSPLVQSQLGMGKYPSMPSPQLLASYQLDDLARAYSAQKQDFGRRLGAIEDYTRSFGTNMDAFKKMTRGGWQSAMQKGEAGFRQGRRDLQQAGAEADQAAKGSLAAISQAGQQAIQSVSNSIAQMRAATSKAIAESEERTATDVAGMTRQFQGMIQAYQDQIGTAASTTYGTMQMERQLQSFGREFGNAAVQQIGQFVKERAAHLDSIRLEGDRNVANVLNTFTGSGLFVDLAAGTTDALMAWSANKTQVASQQAALAKMAADFRSTMVANLSEMETRIMGAQMAGDQVTMGAMMAMSTPYFTHAGIAEGLFGTTLQLLQQDYMNRASEFQMEASLTNQSIQQMWQGFNTFTQSAHANADRSLAEHQFNRQMDLGWANFGLNTVKTAMSPFTGGSSNAVPDIGGGSPPVNPNSAMAFYQSTPGGSYYDAGGSY